METPIQGGTLITCEFSKKLGRALMAVPGNLDSKNSAGCWKLIHEGATMVTCASDIAAAVGTVAPSARKMPPASSKSEPGTDAKASRKSSPAVDKPATPPKSKPQMSLEESAILNAIPSTGITLERLAFITKLPASNVAEATMSLRLKNLIRFLPGNRVAPLSDGAPVN